MIARTHEAQEDLTSVPKAFQHCNGKIEELCAQTFL